MVRQKTATVAIISGSFDEGGIGQRELWGILSGNTKEILLVDCADGPHGLPALFPAQICLVANPDGRELGTLRKDQIAIALVAPNHPYPTRLLDLGYDRIVLLDFSKETIGPGDPFMFLQIINNAISDLNWRLTVWGDEEPFKLAGWGRTD